MQKKLFYGNSLKYLLIITLVVLAVFGRSIFFDYIRLDEDILVTGNHYFYKSGSALKDIFLNNVYYPSGESAYYRPVYVLSFIADTYLGGSPRVFHATNLIFHLLASILVFIFLKKLQSASTDKSGPKSDILALFLFLLFAIHPIAAQAVSWVPARGDSLLTIFLLLSIIQLLDFSLKQRKKYLFGHLLFFSLALFSKETAFIFPVVGIFIYYFSKKHFLKNNGIGLVSGWITIGFFWFLLRQNALGNLGIDDVSILKMLKIVLYNFPAIFLYVGKMLFPVNMSVYPLMADSNLIYGIIAIGVLGGYIVWNRRRLSRYSFIGFVWVLVFLAPILLNYDDPSQMAFFEHRAYLPLVGFLIMMLDFPFNVKQKYAKIMGMITISLLGLITYNYNLNFRNASVFWREAVRVSPGSARAHMELAGIYSSEKKLNDAEREYFKASELNPKEKKAHNNLALLYIKQGFLKKAEAELMKELEVDKFSVIANFNLGNLYARQGMLEKAKPFWLEAIRLDPNHILTHQSLANYYDLKGDDNNALYHINEITKRNAPLSRELKEVLERINRQ